MLLDGTYTANKKKKNQNLNGMKYSPFEILLGKHKQLGILFLTSNFRRKICIVQVLREVMPGASFRDMECHATFFLIPMCCNIRVS